MTQIDKSRFEWIGSDSARREGISRPSHDLLERRHRQTDEKQSCRCVLLHHRASHPFLHHRAVLLSV